VKPVVRGIIFNVISGPIRKFGFALSPAKRLAVLQTDEAELQILGETARQVSLGEGDQVVVHGTAI